MKKVSAGFLLLLASAAVLWWLAPTPPAASAPPRPVPAARPQARVLLRAPLPASAATTASLTGEVLGAGTAPVRVSLLRVTGSQEEPSPVAVHRGGPRFDFGALAAGTYCVDAWAAGRQGSVCGIRLEEGERRTQDLSLEEVGPRLWGVVRDAGGGVVPRARLVAQPHPALDGVVSTEGGEDGGYALTLRPGWYRVSASGEGYTRVTRLVELTADRELDLVLNPASSLSGRVLDADSGAPAGGAAVVARGAWGPPHTTWAGPDGRFELTGLGAGRYRLVAALGSRTGQAEEVALAVGEARRLDLRIAERGAFLEGRVVEGGTGRPLPGIDVRIAGMTEQVARTDDTGHFRASGLVPDEYAVTLAAEGFVRLRRQVLVPEGGRSGVVLSLLEGATVEGRVLLPSGAPARDAVVQSSAWTLEDARLSGVRTGADGRFVLAPLEPGRVRLSAYLPGQGLTEAVDVTAVAGETARVQLVFSAGASVRGAVRFDDSRPATGALVTLASEEGSAAWTTTVGADGRYQVDSLPAGAYSVSVRPPGAWTEDSFAHDPAKVRLDLASGEHEVLDLQVPGGRESIQGRVVDASGAPVGGAAVWVERIVAGRPSGAALAGVEVYSADDGTFLLEHLVRGEYLVGARHVAHARGEVSPVRAGAGDVVVSLRAPARVTGQVVEGGRPVTTFKLSWRYLRRRAEHGGAHGLGERVFVARDGRFELEGLDPSERYEVSAETADGKSGTAEPFALGAAGVATVRVEVKARGTVRGRLVDARSGAGAVGFLVYFGHDAVAPADGAGAFEARLPAGKYERLFVMSEHDDLPPILRAFEVRPGEVTDLGDVRVPSPGASPEHPAHE